MKICPICNAQNNDEAGFCTVCGAKITAGATFSDNPSGSSENNFPQSGARQYSDDDFMQSGDFAPGYQSYPDAQTMAPQASQGCGMPEKERRHLFWSYWGILVLIPLIINKTKNEYYKFHVNQGITATILTVGLNVLSRICQWFLPSVLLTIIGLAIAVCNIALLVWCIQGMLDNKHQRMVPRGLLSKIQIVK